jgi:hypothetical protein
MVAPPWPMMLPTLSFATWKASTCFSSAAAAAAAGAAAEAEAEAAEVAARLRSWFFLSSSA